MPEINVTRLGIQEMSGVDNKKIDVDVYILIVGSILQGKDQFFIMDLGQ